MRTDAEMEPGKEGTEKIRDFPRDTQETAQQERAALPAAQAPRHPHLLLLHPGASQAQRRPTKYNNQELWKLL